MPTITMSLGEKVRAILMQDDTGKGPISRCGERPAWVGERLPLTETEMDLRDWGCVYGIAFGLARSEEPCEPLEQVAERALDAAWLAYRDWGSSIAVPTRDGRGN